MGYMHFRSASFEQVFKSYKYARNNSIKLFDASQKQNILSYSSSSQKQSKYIFQPILFQFQCLVCTTDAYYRKITNAKNQDYGIYIQGNTITSKSALDKEAIKIILPQQLKQLEQILKVVDGDSVQKTISKLVAIMNHEYLHQGQLILMFREVGANLPESYVRAWALG